MLSDRWKSRCSWALAGAVLLVASCNSEAENQAESTDSTVSQPGAPARAQAAPDQVEAVSHALTSDEQAKVNALKKDMSFFKPKFKVKPILNCIDKISSTKYIAHFGYSNSESKTRKIHVGPLNRFYPNPSNRGQPTVFSAGTWNNKVQVKFNGSLLIWGLDGNVAVANSASPLCPKPPPKCPVSCDDSNPCTADLCSASTGFKCVHKPLGNGVSCSDGNACNGEEVCKGGVCKSGKPPVCQDSNSCTDNTCDPKMGCVFVPKPDGTTCPVSGNCGAGGACKAGQCTPNAPSCDDSNPCTADACGAPPTCSLAITQNVYDGPKWWGTITFKNNGPAAVSSLKVEFDIPAGKHCTNDTVPAGAVLSPLAGSGSSAKTVSNHCIFTWASLSPPLATGASKTFNYSTDTQSFTAASNVTASCLGSGCIHTPVAVGTPCSDGDFCNGDEVCDANSQCKAASTPDCNDSNPCTVDSCLSSGGCGHVPGNNGGECTTSSGGAGRCEEGVCQPAVNPCPDDGNACTDEVIDQTTGQCTHPPKVDDTPCNDGNKCTQSDVCKSGTCTGTAPVICSGATACRNPSSCNPSTGLCEGGSPINEGKSCDDDNLCTNGDTCNAGQCKGTAVVCSGDQCHNAGTCDPNTGLCFNPNKQNGTACSDGVKCTGPDVCTDGTCGGDPVVCQASDSCHTPGVCDEGTGQCSNPQAPDGKSCDDGKKCTSGDVCAAGICGGALKVCPPPADSCHVQGICQEATGACDTPAAPDGTTCNDGKSCTTADKCTAGICGGAPVVCTPSDSCHEAGVCQEGTGCTNPPSADGKACNDGVNCTTADRCTAGTCGGTAVVCPQPTDQCHLQGVCVEANGQCTTPTAPDGTVCSDGKACTTGDRCTAGTCGGAQKACPAPKACHLPGTCQEPTGDCNEPLAPNGTACNDGNLCTRTDACSAGSCVGSNPVVCQAGDQCFDAATCNATTGVCGARAPKPQGTSCDDGLRCTSTDVCSGDGHCNGAPVTCAGGLVCRESSGTCENLNTCETCLQGHIISGECDPRIGCANITNPTDRALCVALRDCMLTTRCWANDPLDCYCGSAKDEACLSGAADGACKAEVLAALKTTDPAEAPTLFYDFGLPAAFATQELSCAHDYCSVTSPPACPVDVCADDGNPCTDDKVINGVCTHVPASGKACNDGNACTQTDVCTNGVCTGSNPVQCSGGAACKDAGTCDPSSGLCVGGSNKPNGTPCNDATKCTTNDVCTNGVCGGSPVTCPAPTGACQVAGTCQEATGTCGPPGPAPDGTSCSDGNACTSGDVCTGGACGGTPVVCTPPQTCQPATGQCGLDACGQCLKDAVESGLCEPIIGCANITTGASDTQLCTTLHGCMLDNHCATADPLDCLCGTASGTACLTGANGICANQTLAATKASNFTDAGSRFYDTGFPSGYATQEIACRREFCPGICPL